MINAAMEDGGTACVPPAERSLSPEPLARGDDNALRVSVMSALGESVSFGRFLSDSLDWGKWSSFTHNKYLEDAARHSRPGSVAHKKAFFEANYSKKKKKIGVGTGASGTTGSSCTKADPEDETCKNADVDCFGTVASGSDGESQDSETITDSVEHRMARADASCRVVETDERCHKTVNVGRVRDMDGWKFGEARNELQVEGKKENSQIRQTDEVYTVDKEPLKESSIVYQGSAGSVKKRRLPMSSVLQKASKFSSPPSKNKGLLSLSKRRSLLHSAKENSSPLRADCNSQSMSSVDQKRLTLRSVSMSMNFTRCETGSASLSSRHLGSTIAARICQLESASRPVKVAQSEPSQFRPPKKAFFKGMPEISSGKSQLEEQRSSKVSSIKENKFLGAISPSLHPKTNRSKENDAMYNNETELKESHHSFTFKARPLPNFYHKIKQGKDSSQQSTQENTHLPNGHHPDSKDKQLCCFPIRRLS